MENNTLPALEEAFEVIATPVAAEIFRASHRIYRAALQGGYIGSAGHTALGKNPTSEDIAIHAVVLWCMSCNQNPNPVVNRIHKMMRLAQEGQFQKDVIPNGKRPHLSAFTPRFLDAVARTPMVIEGDNIVLDLRTIKKYLRNHANNHS